MGVLALCLASATAAGAGNAPLTFSAMADHPYQKALTSVLHVAFAKLGYPVRFEFLPPRRALKHANEGKVTGETARIKSAGKILTNMIRVEVPIGSFTGSAASKHEIRGYTGWSSLRPYRIGLIRGSVWASRKTETGYNRVFIANNVRLLQMLARDRIDIALVDVCLAKKLAVRLHPDTGFVYADPPLVDLEMFTYIHKSHADLVAPLTAVLAEMRKSGEMDRIRDAAFDEAVDTLVAGSGQ